MEEKKEKQNPFLCPHDGEKLVIAPQKDLVIRPGQYFNVDLQCPKCGYKRTSRAIV